MTARPTLQADVHRIRGKRSPLKVTLSVHSDRVIDAMRAHVVARAPHRHEPDLFEDDEALAEAYAGELKAHRVEIPIPGQYMPHQVAVVLVVHNVAEITELRTLLDEAEAALTERYPGKP